MGDASEQAANLSIIRIVTCTISVIASLAIIIIIARSRKKLSTTQNRLLVGRSVSDVIASFSMGLSVIPFPSEFPSHLSMGNMATCRTQAFFTVMGSILTPSYNAALAIHYYLKVKHNMSDDAIKKKIEPFMHGIPLVMAITIPIDSVIKDYFHPSAGMCYFQDSPPNCSNDPNVQCVSGEGALSSGDYIAYLIIMFLIIPSVIFWCMGSIYLKVRRQQERLSRFGRGSLSTVSSRPVTRGERRQSEYVKHIMYRGLAYSGAWLITFIFPAVMLFGVLFTRRLPSYSLRVLVALFHSLQGFFNFLIFIYPKVLHNMTLQPEWTVWEAFIAAMKSTNVQRARVRMPRRRSHQSMIVRSLDQNRSHQDHEVDEEIGEEEVSESKEEESPDINDVHEDTPPFSSGNFSSIET